MCCMSIRVGVFDRYTLPIHGKNMEKKFTVIKKILGHESGGNDNFLELKKRIYFGVPFVQADLKVYFSDGSTESYAFFQF